MAKNPAKTKVMVDMGVLSKVAVATQAGADIFLSQAEGMQFLVAGGKVNADLIEVNTGMTDPSDSSKAAVRINQAGLDYLAANQPKNEGSGAMENGKAPFEILSGSFQKPPSKRKGGAGAPTIYPFNDLQVGQFFFVPASAKMADPYKTLGSTVSNKNLQYANKTGETKDRNFTNKTTGQKEIKKIPVYKYTRKYGIAKVEKGQTYGSFTAPESGAVIFRDTDPV